MEEERRLVWRVLRQWNEISDSGRFPRCDEIDPWLRGEDGANCLLIAVESPIQLSNFVAVGVNLAVALSHNDTLAGVLLSSVPKVVSAQRGLMIERGRSSRSGYPLPRRTAPHLGGWHYHRHVLGAMNYRSLRINDVRTMQVNFCRLPRARRGCDRL